MATSVHLSPELLKAVDRRARQLKISRNKFIARSLERELAEDSSWSPGFFEQLRQTPPGLRRAVDEMFEGIRALRTSKQPPRL